MAEQDIARIESMLTVADGKIVYAAGEYEGLAAPLPAPAPESSPVARFGGFQSTACAKRTPYLTPRRTPGCSAAGGNAAPIWVRAVTSPDLTAIDPLTGCF